MQGLLSVNFSRQTVRGEKGCAVKTGAKRWTWVFAPDISTLSNTSLSRRGEKKKNTKSRRPKSHMPLTLWQQRGAGRSTAAGKHAPRRAMGQLNIACQRRCSFVPAVKTHTKPPLYFGIPVTPPEPGGSPSSRREQ